MGRKGLRALRGLGEEARPSWRVDTPIEVSRSDRLEGRSSRPAHGRSRRARPEAWPHRRCSRLAATAVLSTFCVLCLAGSFAANAQAAGAPTDVMFVFDTSGSMQPVLDEAESEIQAVIGRLRETLTNPEFGVAEVRDYGGSEYDEESSDRPWQLDTPITADSATVAETIEGLYANGGGDGPEAYGRALWETDTNPDVGWRAGARHLIVLVADNVPHASNLDEGIAEEFWLSPSPWDTGEELPGSWGIPNTQLGAGNLEFHQVLKQIAADGKPLEMVDYHDTGGDYIHYWEAWAALGGGQALEALEGAGELSSKLIGVIEHAPEDTACASAVQASPATSPPGTAPTTTTPRFGGPGSRIVLAPNAGRVFCQGQAPELGGDVIGTLEEDTPTQIAFRVPGEASDGLGITTLTGGETGYVGYGVDNFRYPWGFEVKNYPGTGTNEYDGKLIPTAADLDSVFTGLGPPGSPEYQEALKLAEEELANGLCYGFALLSWGMYSNAHGAHVPLGYASSAGLSLSSLPYSFVESSNGNHALTHALLRAAISQHSPTAKLAFHKIYSAGSLENQLAVPFAAGRPVPIGIHFKFPTTGSSGGHALLAYDYQASSGGARRWRSWTPICHGRSRGRPAISRCCRFTCLRTAHGPTTAASQPRLTPRSPAAQEVSK